jgi:hypothetical protein
MSVPRLISSAVARPHEGMGCTQDVVHCLLKIVACRRCAVRIDYCYEACQRKNRADSWNDCHSRVEVPRQQAQKKICWDFVHALLELAIRLQAGGGGALLRRAAKWINKKSGCRPLVHHKAQKYMAPRGVGAGVQVQWVGLKPPIEGSSFSQWHGERGSEGYILQPGGLPGRRFDGGAPSPRCGMHRW